MTSTLLGTATTTEGSPTPAAAGSSPQTEVAGKTPAAPAQDAVPATKTAEPTQEAAPVEKAKEGKPEAAQTPKEWKAEDYKLKDGDQDFADPEFAKLAAETKLNPEAAQQILTHLAPKIREAQVNQAKAQIDAAIVKAEQELRQDPEIGGDNLPQVLGDAAIALDQLPGGKEVREMLKGTPYGNNKDITKFLAAAGKLLKPDPKIVKGASADGTTKSWFERQVEINRQNVGS